jgi:hypothetical protein
MATKGIHRKEETALPNSVRERYENEKKKKTQEKSRIISHFLQLGLASPRSIQKLGFVVRYRYENRFVFVAL